VSNVTLIKGDLFSSPNGSIICHAVNCQGIWGAGIAKQFAFKYPEAYKIYQKVCEAPAALLTGKCLILETEPYQIGCLFTSVGYGKNKSSEKQILLHTWYAIQDLLIKNKENKEIYMCKINSGLFGVDWNKTQKVLEIFKEQKFTVYDF